MLVGRDREVGEIDALLADATAGRGRALLIRGEPGIGKTALLDCAGVRADPPARVIATTGVEAEAHLPFAALADIALPLADHLDALPGPQAGAVKAALALSDRPPPAGDRLATCAGLLGLLRAASRERPVLVRVDDAQWLDPPSAECLGYAARRLDASRVAVLAAARADAPVAALSGRPIDELRLDGLPPGDAGALLRTAAGDIAPSAADALIEVAHGNPLALLELPSLLTDEQRRGLAPVTAPPVPGIGLRSAFEQRLGRLSDAARTAVLVAAASSGTTAAPVVAACRELGVEVAAIDEAEAAHVLVAGADHLTLVHPLLRGVILDAATGPERRRAHAALARHTDPDARAWHLAAASVGPSAEAADALDEAGWRAVGRGAHMAAADAFDRSASLTEDPAAQQQRRMVAAVESGFGGEYERAAVTLDGIAAEADPQLALAARHLQALVSLVGGIRPVLENCDALERDALEVSADLPELGAGMFADAAMVAIVGGDARRALAAAEEAERVLPPGAAPLTRCQVAAMHGMARALRGEAAGARRALEGASALLGEIDPLSPAAGSVSFGLHGWICLGETGRLREEVLALGGEVRRAGARGLLPHYLLVAADAALRLGRWDEARAEVDEAVEVADLCGQRGPLAAALVVRCRLRAGTGADAGARADAALVADLARQAGYATSDLGARAALGFLELGLARIPEALALLEGVATDADRAGIDDPLTILWMPDLVEAYCRAGRAEQALDLVATLEARARGGAVPLAGALAARCRGLVADDFDAHFAEALALHERADAPFERARTLLAHGARLHRARRRMDARERLREALAAFDGLGAAPWAERARAELRAAGAIRRMAAGDPDELTAQEERIALAVARGATNREVAAELFISPKTVEFHLGRVYRKLGVRSRTELAALVAEGQLGASAPDGAGAETRDAG